MAAVQKRPVNLSVSAEILGAAKEARINLSAVFEAALTTELARLRRRLWREKNANALEAYNRFLMSHGTCFEGRLDE